MKTFTSKQLTNHQEINNYLILGTQLTDVIDENERIFIELIAHEYDSGRLTYDDLVLVLYDCFEVDKYFDSYSERVINQLALFGFETKQILSSHYRMPKIMLADTYHCLEELKNSDVDRARQIAHHHLETLDKIHCSSSELQALFYSLTHRECYFRYIDEQSCELTVTDPYQWSSNEDFTHTQSLMITAHNNEYELSISIQHPSDECFYDGALSQVFENYNITRHYDQQKDILTLYRNKFSLEELMSFITYVGIEIGGGEYDI